MTDKAHEDAKRLLDERFGDPFVIANAFRDKLDRWPKIASRDGTALRKFADFLKQCTTAMGYMRCLDVLNDDRENRKLLGKLPDWLATGWSRYVYNWKTGNGCFPPFAEFASFVSREANIACYPITSLQSLRGSTDANMRKEDRKKYQASSSFSTDAKIKTLDNDTRSKCTLCQGNHPLDNCKTFLAKPLKERKTFAMQKGLCFGCMEPGHRSKECKMRKSCKTCAKRHPSSLYCDVRRDAREMITTSRTSISTQTSICHCNSSNCCKKSSTIVPVSVSHSGGPDYERLVYALLDTQSDTTFILNDTCAALGVDGTPVQLSLSTMSASNKIIQSSRINGLHVRAYNGDSTIAFPPTQRWPHLHNVTNKLIPLNECEVGLLIGYDCANALVPREVIPPVDGGPYAQTDLGWGIIGVTNTTHDETGDIDAIGVSHRIMVHRVPSSVSTCDNQEVILSCKTMIKLVINPTQIANMMELDFKD